MACCLSLPSCTTKDDLTVWKAAFPAPDGSYIATDETVQNGGFGSGHVDTSVYLAQAGQNYNPVEIIGLSCNGPMPHPYVLDNVANAGGSVNLTVNWITPNHLHVTYRGPAEITFQAVKFANIVITLENSEKGIDHTSDTKPVRQLISRDTQQAQSPHEAIAKLGRGCLLYSGRMLEPRIRASAPNPTTSRCTSHNLGNPAAV
jgi:hypothetical protein